MGRIIKVVTLCALALGMGLLAIDQAPAAYAHDHRVPKTVLMRGQQQLQTGYRVNEYSWTYPAGDGTCANEQALLESRFPDAKRVRAGSRLRVRILKVQRPDSSKVAAYRAVDGNGVPTGKGQLPRKSLKPVVQDGRRIGWDAVFYVNRPGRDYYLVTEGHWKDRQGCGADQFAQWSFHVKTS